MSTILDFYTDHDHKVLEKIASKIPIEFSSFKVVPLNFIPQKSYAYIEKDAATGEDVRRFPINNPASIILSYLYLGENKDQMSKQAYDDTLKKIKTSAKAMDVDLSKFNINESEQEKTAEAVIPEGEKNWPKFITRNLPGGSKENILECMNKFASWGNKLNPKESFEVANEIIKMADILDIPIPKNSKLFKYKMVDCGTLNKEATVDIQIRYDYYPEEMRKAAKTLIGDMKSMPAMTVVNTVYEMDKMAGIIDRYAYDVPDPFIHMFSGKSWSFVNRNRDKKLVKQASAKLSQFFSPDIVKKAEEDVVAAYRELGQQGRVIFRKILDGIDFDKE